MLKRKLTAAKGWLKRATSALASILESERPNVTEIQNAVSFFRDKLKKFDTCQELYENVLEDEEEILDLIDESCDYRDECNKTLVRAEGVLRSMGSTSDKAASSKTEQSAKLPKLELPKFSGDVLNWISFWDQFTAVVHNADMPNIQKFTYLLSLLKDEAKSVISGLSTTDSNYEVARKLLIERYDRKDRIIFAHIQAP